MTLDPHLPVVRFPSSMYLMPLGSITEEEFADGGVVMFIVCIAGDPEGLA